MKPILLTLLLSLLLLFVAPQLGPSLQIQTGDFILWQLRVPRTLVGFLVGMNLGLTGAVYQVIFSNPLATPSTVGTTAGATLGALIALILVPHWSQDLPYLLPLFAFSGALAVTVFIAGIASSGRASISEVLLAGIAISLAVSALTTGLQSQADLAATFAAVRWSLGHLAQVGYEGVLLLAPFTLLTGAVLLAQVRPLETLISGEDRAATQGVSVRRVRTLCLGFGSLAVAATVATCGPIAFVGLIVPHLVRLSVGSLRHLLLPMSALGGGCFVVLCDTLARCLIPEQDLPVGVLTAALGAPTLVGLILSQRRKLG